MSVTVTQNEKFYICNVKSYNDKRQLDRVRNYNFYTEQKWGKASNYTLCLNSSQLGYDRCEMII